MFVCLFAFTCSQVSLINCKSQPFRKDFMIYLQEHCETRYYAPGFGLWLFNFNKPKHSSLLPLCCSIGSEEQLHQVNIIIHFLLLKCSLSCWKITACWNALPLLYLQASKAGINIVLMQVFPENRAQVNTAERRKKMTPNKPCNELTRTQIYTLLDTIYYLCWHVLIRPWQVIGWSSHHVALQRRVGFG